MSWQNDFPVHNSHLSHALQDQLAGIRTLRAISADPCNRRTVVEAGALKALVAAGGYLETTQIGVIEGKIISKLGQYLFGYSEYILNG